MQNKKDVVIQKAEQNVINHCKLFKEFNDILDCISRFGQLYFSQDGDVDEFYEALNQIRKLIDKAYRKQIDMLFSISALGGKEAKKFAVERLREMFKSKDDVENLVKFMKKFSNYPAYYLFEEN